MDAENEWMQKNLGHCRPMGAYITQTQCRSNSKFRPLCVGCNGLNTEAKPPEKTPDILLRFKGDFARTYHALAEQCRADGTQLEEQMMIILECFVRGDFRWTREGRKRALAR